ncbi:rCG24852 [Rattus norvegicus]|uniref:RCG24852 n=1 Tax=Rattus norvegicus TaxID=10116 RepID=A6JBW9_RAT|nr:rCG24852 [Rattus norvegicus]
MDLVCLAVGLTELTATEQICAITDDSYPNCISLAVCTTLGKLLNLSRSQHGLLQ